METERYWWRQLHWFNKSNFNFEIQSSVHFIPAAPEQNNVKILVTCYWGLPLRQPYCYSYCQQKKYVQSYMLIRLAIFKHNS